MLQARNDPSCLCAGRELITATPVTYQWPTWLYMVMWHLALNPFVRLARRNTEYRCGCAKLKSFWVTTIFICLMQEASCVRGQSCGWVRRPGAAQATSSSLLIEATTGKFVYLLLDSSLLFILICHIFDFVIIVAYWLAGGVVCLCWVLF